MQRAAQAKKELPIRSSHHDKHVVNIRYYTTRNLKKQAQILHVTAAGFFALSFFLALGAAGGYELTGDARMLGMRLAISFAALMFGAMSKILGTETRRIYRRQKNGRYFSEAFCDVVGRRKA